MRIDIPISKGYDRIMLCLSCTWICGLFAGAYIALKTTTIHNSWTQLLYYSHLSVIGFLAMLTFPFILSAILLRISLRGFVIPLLFLKAFSYSWCACFLRICFANAGWLLHLLLFFSNTVLSSLLLWFCLRNWEGKNRNGQYDLLLCLVFILVIGYIDSSVVSPFGVSLLSNI